MMRGIGIVAVVVASATAFAHGDETHPMKKKPYSAASVEEKAFGHEGDPAKVDRIIKVSMSDAMRFSPSDITIKRGETIKFVVHNDGKVLHEMVLGTPAELQEHAALMSKFPEMEHADANMAHVKPGTNGEIVWQFTEPGEFQFACLIPGHFEAGMVGKVRVK